jgi:ABC-type phosphate transport system substrate-binding protein
MTPVPSRIGSLLAATLIGSCLSAGAVAEVVAVVSTKCPVSTLSKNQVADIFLGRAARFPDGSAAVPIDQVEGSPARDEFYLTFAGKSAAQLNAHWSKIIFTGRGQPPAEVASGAEVKKRLAANPTAIGYIEAALVDSQVRVVATP